MRLGLGELTDGAGAAMLVPLSFHGRALGMLVALDRFDSTSPYSADDERLMRAFAGSAATALATAQNVEAERLRMSIAAADQERRRWARELHDETLQGLGRPPGHAHGGHSTGPDAGGGAVERGRRADRDRGPGAPGLITELRPAALDELGLAPALDTLYARVQARGLEVTSQRSASEVGDGRRPLDPEIEGTIYRLVQEALTNIAKHADTGRAQARITEAHGKISVEIVDEGAGFDPGRHARASGWSACASGWSSSAGRSRSTRGRAPAPASGRRCRRRREPAPRNARPSATGEYRLRHCYTPSREREHQESARRSCRR